MGNRVYVSNLPFSATKEDIVEFFGGAEAGVVDVAIPMDRETGRPRGFAFIEFSDDARAEKAILDINGASMGGRELRVSEAHARTGGGGGGRRDDRRGGGRDERRR